MLILFMRFSVSSTEFSDKTESPNEEFTIFFSVSSILKPASLYCNFAIDPPSKETIISGLLTNSTSKTSPEFSRS